MVVKIKKIIKILFIPMFLICASINYGCSPAGMLATGGGGAMVVAEGERSLGTVVDDATIKVNIAAKFLNAGNNLFVNINTSVLEGRILLTGLVDNQEIRIDAVRLVWEVEGVKEIDLYKEELKKMSKKFSLTDIVEIVHKFTKINKNKIYKWLLKLKK